MTDLGYVHYRGSRDELNAKLRERDDAIERLTKERDEAIEALRVAIDAVNGEGGVTVGQIHAAAAILSKHEVKNDSN